MSFRTIIINSRSKLDLSLNRLQIRDGEHRHFVFLDDIDILIIENPSVCVTGCLLSALVEKKIKVIFCDSNHNPQAELLPYYGCSDCSRKIKKQLLWLEETKGNLWTMIVAEKIKKQAEHLQEIGYQEQANLVNSYIKDLEYRDITNREGFAAKVYFGVIFGDDFSRSYDCAINAALNYGYAIILSCINREIVSNGYLTQLGIFHDNTYNQFNLSCDFMEPYRIIVDRFVRQKNIKNFGTYEKHSMANLLYERVNIAGNSQTVLNSIKIYVKSLCDALTGNDLTQVRFYEL